MSVEEKEGSSRTVKAGKFYVVEEIKTFRKNFERHHSEKKDLRKAEYFSKEIIEQLLKIEGCDGVRIYYGLAPENAEGHIDPKIADNLQPRLFLVPVHIGEDGLGRDINFKAQLDTTGEKDGGDEDGGAGGGAPCPAFCNP